MGLIIFTVIIVLKNYPKMLYYTDSSALVGLKVKTHQFTAKNNI